LWLKTLYRIRHSYGLFFLHNYMDFIHQTLSGSKLYYEINKINFLEGLYHVKRGNQEKGLALANNALMIMKNLKDFESAQRHEEILQQYLKE
ncbi:Rgg family transcriptional regulator, partial [Enterococcus nangangensis]|uniref:Rgg family transcriptional regulator n=1 Tax=Enterococcus nangangensis TaxID=2559926 RepID=UPI0014853BBE